MFFESWLPTISFWCAFFGIALWLFGKKSPKIHGLVTLLFLIVGIGGTGASYGFFAGQNHILVTPMDTLQEFFGDNYAKGRTLALMGTVLHGVFGVWALARVRVYWRAWHEGYKCKLWEEE